MVSLITTFSGVAGPQAAPGGAPKTGDSAFAAPVQVQSAPQPAPEPVATPVTDTTSDEIMSRRADLLKQALTEALPKFFYPVTDVRFTIFKDTSGQFITRFTNIITGAVSQIPEPEMLNMLGGSFGGSGGFVQTTA